MISDPESVARIRCRRRLPADRSRDGGRTQGARAARERARSYRRMNAIRLWVDVREEPGSAKGASLRARSAASTRRARQTMPVPAAYRGATGSNRHPCGRGRSGHGRKCRACCRKHGSASEDARTPSLLRAGAKGRRRATDRKHADTSAWADYRLRLRRAASAGLTAPGARAKVALRSGCRIVPAESRRLRRQPVEPELGRASVGKRCLRRRTAPAPTAPGPSPS